MIFTPICGLPIVELTDSPNAFTLNKGLADKLDGLLIPRFQNTSERDTAIPTPQEGQAAFIITDGAFQFYSGGAWTQVYPPLIPSQGFLELDEDVTSNTDGLVDTNLRFSVPANSLFTFKVFLHYRADHDNGSAKVGFSFPSGADFFWVLNGLAASVADDFGVIDMAMRQTTTPRLGSPLTNTSSNDCCALVEGKVKTKETAGQVILRWAQFTAAAGSSHAAILIDESYIEWEQRPNLNTGG